MSLPHNLQKVNLPPPEFYARETLRVARDLLGMRLVRLFEGRRLAGRIVEVEAYIGVTDRASHAAPGLTERNAPMFGPPGRAYVYLIYGMYFCFNIVTEAAGFPAAILVRAVEPLEGLETMRRLRQARRKSRTPLRRRDLARGPGRLCQALAIDRTFSGLPLGPRSGLWVEFDAALPDALVARSPRINVRGDAQARDARWRFFVRQSPWVSGQRSFNRCYEAEQTKRRPGNSGRLDGEGEI